MGLIPDVDIDLSDPMKAMGLFPIVRGSQFNTNKDDLVLHKTGVYMQNIPIDPMTGYSSYPYDMAEELGFYKLDFIKNHIYDGLTNNDIQELINHAESDEFDWDIFNDEKYYGDNGIAHLGRWYHVVKQYPPRSVSELASLLAVIRPQKSHLIGQSKKVIQDNIWATTDDDTYSFKKSHAIAYALMVLIHIQILQLLSK